MGVGGSTVDIVMYMRSPEETVEAPIRRTCRLGRAMMIF
jgi:hypothetical protein